MLVNEVNRIVRNVNDAIRKLTTSYLIFHAAAYEGRTSLMKDCPSTIKTAHQGQFIIQSTPASADAVQPA